MTTINTPAQDRVPARIKLECGHIALVDFGRSGAWCPACNELRLVDDAVDPAQPTG